MRAGIGALGGFLLSVQGAWALEYQVIQMPVRAFVDVVVHDGGARAEISPNVKMTIASHRFQGTVGEVLAQLEQAADVDVFRFNGTYHVSALSEATTRLVLLEDVEFAVAVKALARSGVEMDKYPVTEAADGRALAVTGPPKLLAIVEAVIKSMKNTEEPLTDEKTVRIRRGIESETVKVD